jgi:membrane protease YdiL (CAAX protease family)
LNATLQSIGNFFNWQRIPAGVIQFKSLDKETRFLLAYAVLYIISGYLSGLLILWHPMPIMGATQFNQDFWYSIVFKILLLLVVPGLIYFFLWKYTIQKLLLGISPTVSNTVATAIMVILGFFLNASHLPKIIEAAGHFPDAGIRLLVGVIMPLVTAALPEELYFRGYLQTRLEQKWGRVVAILLSSVLFTAWHLPSRYLLSSGVEGQAGDFAGVLLQTGLPVFIIGIIFGIHWSRYRNIILLILTHWAIDILPSVSSYFKIRF